MQSKSTYKTPKPSNSNLGIQINRERNNNQQRFVNSEQINMSNKIVSSTTSIKKTQPKLAYSLNGKKKVQETVIDRTSKNIWEHIFLFVISDAYSMVKLTRVCKKFYQTINERDSILIHLINLKYTKAMMANQELYQAFLNFKLNKNQLWSFIKDREISSAQFGRKTFLQGYQQIFNYGHVKENIPNKLISKMQISIDVEVNKNRPYYYRIFENIPYKMKLENNLTHLVFQITKIGQLKFDISLEEFNFDITIKSNFIKSAVQFSQTIKKKELLQQKHSTKVFNYYPDKNLIYVYFHDDSKVLYLIFEISALDILRKFNQRIYLQEQLNSNLQKGKVQKSAQIQSQQKKSGDLKLRKVFKPATEGEFYEYIKNQLDFDVHFNIQNHCKSLFNFVDTKFYPISIESNKAIFKIDVQLQFKMQKYEFKLDDQQGLIEILKDFFIIDLILKDKENILISHSGFIQAIQIEKENYINYVQNSFELSEDTFELALLKYTSPSYTFQIVMIKDNNQKVIHVDHLLIELNSSIIHEL